MTSSMQRLVSLLQAKGIILLALACLVGTLAGIVVTAMSRTVQAMHTIMFALPVNVRLSGMLQLSELKDALVPALVD